MEKYTIQDMDNLENLLARTLYPVEPNKKFVKNLHTQLSESQVQVVTRTSDRSYPYLLLPLVSILIGLFIITTNLRLMLSFVGILSLAQQLRQQASQKRISSTPAL